MVMRVPPRKCSKDLKVDSKPTKRLSWNWVASLRTGIVLLILVVVASALGTMILQRPMTVPQTMTNSYSPAALHWLDRLGLTDVFHAWLFAALLALLGINIVFASLDRFPGVWRFFSRPYRRPESYFLAGLPLHKVIPVRNAAQGLGAAERVLRLRGYQPQRVGQGSEASLYVERHRFARLAPYVVHASLLLIFAGGILDAVVGYRGFVALGPNEQVREVDLGNGRSKALPFAVRCDAAGQGEGAGRSAQGGRKRGRGPLPAPRALAVPWPRGAGGWRAAPGPGGGGPGLPLGLAALAALWCSAIFPGRWSRTHGR